MKARLHQSRADANISRGSLCRAQISPTPDQCRNMLLAWTTKMKSRSHGSRGELPSGIGGAYPLKRLWKQPYACAMHCPHFPSTPGRRQRRERQETRWPIGSTCRARRRRSSGYRRTLLLSPTMSSRRKPAPETPAQRAEKLAGVKARVYIAQAKERAKALPVVEALFEALRKGR